MKNIILFRFSGSNKDCLRDVSTQMQTDNVLVYKFKETGNWYKWEKSSTGRPEAISYEEKKELLFNPENKIINWGNHVFSDDVANFVANKPSACKISSNKWHTRKIWQENNIKTPKSSNDVADMVDFPFIARPQKHARQSEFHVVNNIQDFLIMRDKVLQSSESWYYQKIVPKTCEFRVYVGGDKVLTTFWKDNGDQLLSSNSVWKWLDDIYWNPDKLPPCVFGEQWGTSEYYLNLFKEDIVKIKEECVKATKVLGLDYSGIDVGLDTNNRKFNLFESNTDPELTPLPRRKFAQYFDSLLTTV